LRIALGPATSILACFGRIQCCAGASPSFARSRLVALVALWLRTHADIMRPFRRGPLYNVVTNDAPLVRQIIARVFVRRGRRAMTRTQRSPHRTWIARLAGLLGACFLHAAVAQVPIPVQEQVRLFNSLPPAQQQSLIRELQGQLPPAQRDAIVNMLQGQSRGQGGGPTPELDATASAALQDALNKQGAAGGLDAGTRAPRLMPHDSLVIRFEARKDDPRAAASTADEQTKL
jgi:hypothetical protein